MEVFEVSFWLNISHKSTSTLKFNCFLCARRCVRAWGHRRLTRRPSSWSAQAVAAEGPNCEANTGPHRPHRAWAQPSGLGSVLRGRRHAKPRRGNQSAEWPSRQWTARVRSCDRGPSAGRAESTWLSCGGMGQAAARRDDSSTGFVVKTTETTHGGRPRDLVWPAGSVCPPGQRLTGKDETGTRDVGQGFCSEPSSACPQPDGGWCWGRRRM